MSRRYVAFEVGNTRYGLEITEVKQIVGHENVTPVPQAPPFVEGLINLSGDVVPVIAMRARLGVTEGGVSRKGRVIVVEHAARQYGLHVDDVREIVEVEDSDVTIQGTPIAGSESAFVSGEARVGDGRLFLLSLQKLLDASTEVTP